MPLVPPDKKGAQPRNTHSEGKLLGPNRVLLGFTQPTLFLPCLHLSGFVYQATDTQLGISSKGHVLAQVSVS